MFKKIAQLHCDNEGYIGAGSRRREGFVWMSFTHLVNLPRAMT